MHVVEQKSFTRASETLQMHRPSISKSIQQLEDELGIKLLHRTTRKLSVTEEGIAFYQRCKNILGDMNDIMTTFSPTQHPKGRLRLDVPLALVHSIIIPRIAEFQALYPDIEIILTATDRKTDLLAEGVDCVIRLGDLEDSSFISKRLGLMQMVTCAAPSYISRFGEPLTPDDLTDHHAVNFFSEHSRALMDWKYFMNGKIVSRRPASSIMVNNSDVLLNSGLAGLGIIHSLRIPVEPFLKSGVLKELLKEFPSSPKPVSLLWPDRQYLSPKVRVFIDWLSDIFSKIQEKN